MTSALLYCDVLGNVDPAGGHSILSSFRKLEEKVTALEEKNAALEEKVTTLEGKNTALEEKVTALEDQAMILRALRDKAISTRVRFFSSIIERGKYTPLSGDVVTDAFLLKNEIIGFGETFKILYGLEWKEATELISKLIDLIWPSLANFYF